MQRIILAHYHEIGLKGHNRTSFEKRLQSNIRKLIASFPVFDVSRISGRIVVLLSDDADLSLQLECANLISRIPGVARASCGFVLSRDIEAIYNCAIAALGECDDFESFKVKARRAHTDFPIDSMQLNRDVGAALCSAFPDKKVLMKEPDITVGVEIIQGNAYVYAHSIRGIGGLPVGSSGRISCLLSTGIDSPVALWRMARRGAVCIGVHFSGAPETSDDSEYLVKDIACVLAKTGCISKLYTIQFGSYQREISLNAPASLRVILYRRLMMKVAAKISEREHAKALATGESLGQVASQTLDNLVCTDAAVEMPILRPLIGTDKLEIIDEAQKLGTFDLSVQDSPDCCTLFMPKSPETHAKLNVVEQAEAVFPIDDWVDELVENACVEDFRIS